MHRTPASPSPAPRTSAHGAQAILIIDDAEDVCRVMRSMLERRGYSVATVENGRAGVDYYRKHAGTIDLVILDLIMPAMDGRACLQEIRKMDPTARVLITTGHSVDRVAETLSGGDTLHCIGKPFLSAELIQAVERALSS